MIRMSTYISLISCLKFMHGKITKTRWTKITKLNFCYWLQEWKMNYLFLICIMFNHIFYVYFFYHVCCLIILYNHIQLICIAVQRLQIFACKKNSTENSTLHLYKIKIWHSLFNVFILLYLFSSISSYYTIIVVRTITRDFFILIFIWPLS